MSKHENIDKKKTTDRIIRIILIIIILLLLLQNCSLIKKKNNQEKSKTNIIDIKCNSNKCQQGNDRIDCLQEEKNSKCLIPNFVGQTKKNVIDWINSISNNIELEIKYIEDKNYKDGVIIEQSITGTNVKDLIIGRTKLVITIVNNGSLVDCQKDSQNTKCILPNFIDKKKSEIESWLESIANNIKIKYIYVNSTKESGTIISQSIKSGSSIKEMLDKGETIIIYISKGNQNDNQSNNQNDKQSSQQKESEQEPKLDDDFYASDNEKIKWNDDTNINIFKDSTKISKVNGKIAPESKGVYKFKVNNGTKYDLKYKISLIEENQNNINIKYKLKKENTYLVNHYVSPDQINIDNMILSTNKTETYYLEWKWIGDSDGDDTTIGKNAKENEINYSLKINIEAENINE